MQELCFEWTLWKFFTLLLHWMHMVNILKHSCVPNRHLEVTLYQRSSGVHLGLGNLDTTRDLIRVRSKFCSDELGWVCFFQCHGVSGRVCVPVPRKIRMDPTIHGIRCALMQERMKTVNCEVQVWFTDIKYLDFFIATGLITGYRIILLCTKWEQEFNYV